MVLLFTFLSVFWLQTKKNVEKPGDNPSGRSKRKSGDLPNEWNVKEFGRCSLESRRKKGRQGSLLIFEMFYGVDTDHFSPQKEKKQMQDSCFTKKV